MLLAVSPVSPSEAVVAAACGHFHPLPAHCVAPGTLQKDSCALLQWDGWLRPAPAVVAELELSELLARPPCCPVALKILAVAVAAGLAEPQGAAHQGAMLQRRGCELLPLPALLGLALQRAFPEAWVWRYEGTAWDAVEQQAFSRLPAEE
jgi:hypothetical protein